MCSQLIYGSMQFWQHEEACHISSSSDGFWKVILGIAQCDPWVAWVTANGLLHLAWVTMLLICQIYQVIYFATTFYTLNKHFSI